MNKSLKTQVLCLALLIFLLAPSCHAQIYENLDIDLTHRRSPGVHRVPMPVNGEFKLSLGSQMMDSDENVSGENNMLLDRPEVTRIFPDSDNTVFFQTPAAAKELRFKTRQGKKQKRFGPTITLTNSYDETTPDFNETPDDGLSINSEQGRLKVYGEFEKKIIPQLPVSQTSKPEEGEVSSILRGSMSEPGDPANTEPTDKNSAIASRYYLEAVYSFKPTLKGKVSFKRSMIDTFESEEKLQVEGIVEANRNVLIKAGYNNEVRPEVTEPRSSKDTKVWTEFILKF